MFKKLVKYFYKPALWMTLTFFVFYGAAHLYYAVTGGFTLGNITYDLPYNPQWELTPLTNDRLEPLDEILNQKFFYLSRGCQAYVFESEDKKYVLKFFKYQHFRPKPWLAYLAFLPIADRYYQKKVLEKRQALEEAFASWKLALEELQPETGVLYVHLNKSKNLQKNVVIVDKMGLSHHLNIEDYEFLIQRKATLLCPALAGMMEQGDVGGAKQLIASLIERLVSEYRRGYRDNDGKDQGDLALMKNTGVLNGQPVHIDVGQLVKDTKPYHEERFYQEIFYKTATFRSWLERHYPELANHLSLILEAMVQTKTQSHVGCNIRTLGDVRFKQRRKGTPIQHRGTEGRTEHRTQKI
jgi:hypothetical protein